MTPEGTPVRGTPIPILSQINPVHTLEPYFCKIEFTVMLPSTPRSSKMYLSFMHVGLISVLLKSVSAGGCGYELLVTWNDAIDPESSSQAGCCSKTADSDRPTLGRPGRCNRERNKILCEELQNVYRFKTIMLIKLKRITSVGGAACARGLTYELKVLLGSQDNRLLEKCKRIAEFNTGWKNLGMVMWS